MTKTEELRRIKAKELRYRKPIVRNLNLDFIREDLYEISEECEEVRWFYDTDEETLIGALDGDEDEAYEFKTMFADLCAECEQMQEDLNDKWKFIPECFDLFFVAIGAGDSFGGLLGYDSYEGDYFGIGFNDTYAEQESAKKLKRFSKDELIINAQYCFRIYQAYVGIRHRYDCLKASLDILRDANTGYLMIVKQIDELYDKAVNQWDRHDEHTKPSKDWKKYLDALPREAWIA